MSLHLLYFPRIFLENLSGCYLNDFHQLWLFSWEIAHWAPHAGFPEVYFHLITFEYIVFMLLLLSNI